MSSLSYLQIIRRGCFYHKYKKHLKSDLPKSKTETKVTIGSGSILNIDVYDVLDNKQVSKLARSLAKLKKKSFKVDLLYKNSKFKAINYIRPQFDYRSIGSFATIEPLNDKLISKIDIGWTQINNDEAVFEYSFQLSKPIESVNQCIDEILSHWDEVMNLEVLPFYKSADFIISLNDQDNQHIEQMFLSIFQGFINKNLYTNLGHKYQLPVNILQLSNSSKDINNLIKNKHVFAHTFKKTKSKKTEYLIHNPINKWMITTSVLGKSYSSHGLLQYFSDFGMDYYYYVFNEIEVSELSSNLMKYLNSGKTKMALRNRKWLFKKFRRVSEVKLYERSRSKTGNIVGVSKDVKGVEYGGRDLAVKFRDVYEDNLKYTNSVFDLTNVHIWAWVIFAISIIGLLINVFKFFFPTLKDIVDFISLE